MTISRDEILVRRAVRSDAAASAALAAQMWSAHSADELTSDFEELIASNESAVFLCFADGRAIGFAQCQLRRDYVEGTSASPVGYLEGVFVEAEYRRQRFGKMLVCACEAWAKEQGCTEFASDCELDNRQSLAFHLHAGFQEANRIICFVKKL